MCGKETDKLYDCKFTDDPEDIIGYTSQVCDTCVPENQEDVFDNQ